MRDRHFTITIIIIISSFWMKRLTCHGPPFGDIHIGHKSTWPQSYWPQSISPTPLRPHTVPYRLHISVKSYDKRQVDHNNSGVGSQVSAVVSLAFTDSRCQTLFRWICGLKTAQSLIQLTVRYRQPYRSMFIIRKSRHPQCQWSETAADSVLVQSWLGHYQCGYWQMV